MSDLTAEELEQQRAEITAKVNAPKPVIIEVRGFGVETTASGPSEVKIIKRE